MILTADFTDGTGKNLFIRAIRGLAAEFTRIASSNNEGIAEFESVRR